MPSQTEWDRRYLRLAREIASWSRDVSTKVGAILVDAQHIAVATGHNGFVSGLRDTPERLNNRETRLKLSLHGEENALINAGKSGHAVLGATCYVWPLPRALAAHRSWCKPGCAPSSPSPHPPLSPRAGATTSPWPKRCTTRPG